MNNIDRFKSMSVLVIGDMMTDRYIIGTVSRISPEAPVPVLRQREIRRKLGGSGNVILNLCSLGAGVRAVGRICKRTVVALHFGRSCFHISRWFMKG